MWQFSEPKKCHMAPCCELPDPLDVVRLQRPDPPGIEAPPGNVRPRATNCNATSAAAPQNAAAGCARKARRALLSTGTASRPALAPQAPCGQHPPAATTTVSSLVSPIPSGSPPESAPLRGSAQKAIHPVRGGSPASNTTAHRASR